MKKKQSLFQNFLQLNHKNERVMISSREFIRTFENMYRRTIMPRDSNLHVVLPVYDQLFNL